MRNSIVLLSILIVSSALIMGCQTNPKFQDYDEKVDEKYNIIEKVPVYFWDRFLDLTDIIQLDMGFGDGFLVNGHITKWAQAGAGYRDSVCFGIMPRSFGMWYEDRTEGGLAVPILFNLYYKNMQREALWGTTTLFDHDVQYKGADHLSNATSHWSSIGLNMHFFLIGADADVIPFEIVDFVLGWFGMPFIVPIDPVGFGTEIDTANDDLRARKVRNDNSDLPYYNYTTDPRPRAQCDCGNTQCSGCGSK